MAFNPFATRVASYNATLPTLTNTDIAELQVDSRGRLIVASDSAAPLVISDGSGSITVDGTFWQATQPVSGTVAATQSGAWTVAATQSGAWTVTADAGTGPWPVTDNGGSLTVDGTVAVSAVSGTVSVSNGGTFAVQEDGPALTALQLIDNLVLLEDAAAAGGEAGVQMLAVRQDTLVSTVSADGDFASLKVNALGELYVTGSLTASVDDVFESGTEADQPSDAAGDGIVAITGSMTALATIANGAGQTLYITGLDISADKQITYELVVIDDATPTDWIRVGVIDGAVSHNKTFPRAIQIAGAADQTVVLRAQVNQGSSGNASGAINAYVR